MAKHGLGKRRTSIPICFSCSEGDHDDCVHNKNCQCGHDCGCTYGPFGWDYCDLHYEEQFFRQEGY